MLTINRSFISALLHYIYILQSIKWYLFKGKVEDDAIKWNFFIMIFDNKRSKYYIWKNLNFSST